MRRKTVKVSKKATALVNDKYWGSEPVLNMPYTTGDLVAAYNWYNAVCETDQAKTFITDYLKTVGYEKKHLKAIEAANIDILRNVGWNCRILSRGYELPSDVESRMWSKITAIVTAKNVDEPAPQVEVEPIEVKPVVSVQDRIANKARELISDLNGEIDTFFIEGKNDFDIAKWLINNDVKPQIAQKIADYFKPNYAEVYDALKGKDDQLVEGYKKWKKPTLKAFGEFLKNIIASAESRSVAIKAVRKPRKKKVKPASVLVSKLKFAAQDQELNIKSINPQDIIGASQLWVYNTKYRSLTVYNAMGPAGLSVKGSSLLGFDEKTSIVKRLRKPNETMPALLSAGKVALRKLMDNIRTKSKEATGRINSDTVLVRVVK